jgi:hypothetical protein
MVQPHRTSNRSTSVNLAEIEQSIKDRTIFGHIKTFQLPDMLVLILRGD